MSTASPARQRENAISGDRRSLIKGERQRRAILDGLADLLATRPIAELTVGEIATATGVTRSGFYFYFDSKYAALVVATSEIMAELTERVYAYRRLEAENAEQYLTRTASAAMDVWRRHEAVLVASVQAAPFDGQLAKLWRDWNDRLTATLVDMIVEDRRKGLANPVNSDVDTLVHTLGEMTMHMFYQDRIEDHDAKTSARILDSVVAIWMAAIWPSEASKRSADTARRRRPAKRTVAKAATKRRTQ
jgi:AcrR family transcriptional regulator